MYENLQTPNGMSRRHFMGHMATTAMTLPAFQFVSALQAQADTIRKNNKSLILLWMGGGPSHMDTWDLKPESKNGGEFKPIDTAAPGIQICEHLPTIAKQFKHLSIVRSLNSKEGNHDRGTYMMHTGYAPNPTVVHPGFGSVCSMELGHKLGDDFSLPHCVAINTPGEGAGFLGMTHAPFYIQNPNAPVSNLLPPKEVNALRMRRRLAILGMSEKNFLAQNRGQAAKDHQAVYTKTIKMMNSQYTNAFKLDQEPAAVREAYGKDSFGSGCLMARRLVEQGVSFVEVSLGGWDNHNDIFNTLSRGNLPKLDKAMGTLVSDLAQRGLLDKTMIVWMGDFGRTPKINQNGGRDHWPRSWSVVMGGGGLKGGQLVGSTDKDGIDVSGPETGVMDIIATMTKGLGIDLATQYTTPNGRPIKLVDGGKPIKELF
ncbi:MAG: DUF1501 domain-containing protein [Isosphaeraceae bacterium]